MQIHQDFDLTGMIDTVEIFSNRISITNPGAPLIEANRFIDKPPKSRNEDLAQAMFLFNLCERRGSGMDRAVESVEEMCLPGIEVKAGEDYTVVSIFPQKKYTEMSKEEKILACYQHACLLDVDKKVMTNQSLRERLGIGKNNAAGATRIIADALEAGVIKRANVENGAKKFSAYKPFCKRSLLRLAL